MRLSGPVKGKFADASAWLAAVTAAGYTAAELPLGPADPPSKVDEFLAAAAESDIAISEVGAWSNPIDPDSGKAEAALAFCQEQLRWAERIGARCCVNIAGSRNPNKWDGPSPDNFSKETFERIVISVQRIVDAVNPVRTRYSLETMPWIFPSGPDEYLELLRAIDRPGIAVHLDPVNMINTPSRSYNTTAFLEECFSKLVPHIKSCHAKDITLQEQLTVHLDECRPGTGAMDYATFLRELAKLDADTTLCLEHLPDEEYSLAARYLTDLADSLGIGIHGGASRSRT